MTEITTIARKQADDATYIANRLMMQPLSDAVLLLAEAVRNLATEVELAHDLKPAKL